MTATFAALGKALADGPAAVVLIERTQGSTPREAGAWMIVTRHAIRGTIGGGEAERRAVEAARGCWRTVAGARSSSCRLVPSSTSAAAAT